MSSIYNQLESGDTQNKTETPETGAKKKVLGKGLNALISDLYGKPKSETDTSTHAIHSMVNKTFFATGVQDIDLGQIQPSKEQPRSLFSDEKLQELADSIKEQGIIQPVIVKRATTGYELICGERRYRAAKKCGLEKIPAIVKEVAEDKLLEWALIENIQREDLNAIEEANAYLRLAEERQLSHEEIGKKVGKNRTTIVNSIRLLRLPKEILDFLVEGKIQAGHARALLALPTAEYQTKMAQKIVSEGLTVRQVEEMVLMTNKRKRRAKRARILTAELRDLESKLEEKFGTQVRIYASKDNSGRLEFRYYSLDDLDRMLKIFGVKDL